MKRKLYYYWCKNCGTDSYGFKDCRWTSYEESKWCPRCFGKELLDNKPKLDKDNKVVV